jgi:hypothetical protein
MSRVDSIALPVWALNQEGHALVERIITERPDHYVTRGQWVEGGGVTVFRGATAGKLRQMHNRWLDREQAELDARYNETRVWDQEASDALHRTENGNQLIERVLRETQQEQLVEVELLEPRDGRERIAA